jgi:hypothetical protein
MANQVPPQATFTVVLSKLIEGAWVIKDPKCKFSYIWDFKRGEGLAYLEAINGSAIGITLHPLGVTGILGFMSDMAPTEVTIDGKKIILFRIILTIRLSDNVISAAIMFNQEGDCIEATDTWNANDAAGLAR